MRGAEENRGLVLELVRRVATEKEALAEELGVSYASLYAWSTGRRRPGGRVLQRMAELAERRAGELTGLAGRLRDAAGEGRSAPPGGADRRDGGGGRSGAQAFDGVGTRR